MRRRSPGSPSRGGSRVAYALGALLALAALSGCSPPPERASAAPVVAGTATASPLARAPAATPAPDNPTQRQMMSLPKAQQAAILARAVGHGCTGASPFFMGMGDNGSAIWSLRCTRGHTWAVAINPDEAGTTTVMRCTTFKTKTHLDCFRKF